MNTKTQKSDAEWRAELSPEQYEVLRRKGTERAFTGKYNDTKDPGIYRCAGCGAELFRSQAKFDSGSGWPSFVEPATLESVVTETDTS
jgi:peptide-methionine (R)-S-oxide reductase